jgi:hypothetical protein
MLSATMVAPPQPDEFIVGDDHAARAADMALLGWSEADLMRWLAPAAMPRLR